VSLPYTVLSTLSILTNRERREDVAFLVEHWKHESKPTPYTVLPANVFSDEIPSFEFFRLLCFHALNTQPAPTVVIEADWRRLEANGTIGEIWNGSFDINRYALDPPVWRPDSKGKVIDFVRIKATEDTWKRLLPEPPDPDVAVDVIYAASGGALKSRAFNVIADMRRCGWWHSEALDRFAQDPGARSRKRAIRMGLIDLPERADTFADMKALSRAINAVLRLGDAPELAYSAPITTSPFRCEICDAARMAACPMPHCKWRRMHAE